MWSQFYLTRLNIIQKSIRPVKAFYISLALSRLSLTLNAHSSDQAKEKRREKYEKGTGCPEIRGRQGNNNFILGKFRQRDTTSVPFPFPFADQGLKFVAKTGKKSCLFNQCQNFHLQKCEKTSVYVVLKHADMHPEMQNGLTKIAAKDGRF